MNKKQFYTGQQSSSPNPSQQNNRKHKFSNFVDYQNGINTFPVTNTIHNDHETASENRYGKDNSHIGKEAEGSKQKNQLQFIKEQNRSVNPKISQLGMSSNKNISHESDQKKTPIFPNPSSNNRSVSPVATNKRPPQPKIREKCIICQTMTQKCCSLCRKVFYCSAEHQEVDWHMRHKFECEGRVRTNPTQQHQSNAQGAVAQGDRAYGNQNTNKFVFYSDNMNQPQIRSNQLYERQMDYQAIQKFLQLLQQRLVLRSKIINQVNKLNDRTPIIVRQSLVKQTEQLLQLSSRITNQEFKPSFSRKITRQDIMEYSSQQWGSQIVVSQTGVGLQYYSDLLLMVKMYHLCGMTKQARESIISIGRLLQDPQQKNLFLHSESNSQSSVHKKLSFTSVNSSPSPNVIAGFQTTNTNPHHRQDPSPRSEDSLSKTRNLLLESIISLGQLYNIDKTSESAYKLFIKKIELEEGIWEQIYAYFNMGVWYSQKTYFDKSIKSFLYALELLDSHKKGTAQSAVFKADCLFNVGLDYWATGERILAIENMQECYRVRMNSIGKNSMQSSYCLYHLAKWYKMLQKWNECLQYLDECHRIRKLYQNQPAYSHKVEQIKILISEVHSSIQKQKKRNKEAMNSRTQKYFAQILQQQMEQEQKQENDRRIKEKLLPQGTVASRLFREEKEEVQFNMNISSQLFSKLGNDQVSLLNKLLDRFGERVEKSKAIGILLESEFVASLNNQMREEFFKDNQIKKSPF